MIIIIIKLCIFNVGYLESRQYENTAVFNNILCETEIAKQRTQDIQDEALTASEHVPV
jgi:hypothetical protein